MIPTLILDRAPVTTSVLRWAIALASMTSATATCVAYVAERPLVYVAVFFVDIAVAALATIAAERTLDPSTVEARPSPEELALYVCLHCGVVALLLMSLSGGVLGLGLLALHQTLLLISARRLLAT